MKKQFKKLISRRNLKIVFVLILVAVLINTGFVSLHQASAGFNSNAGRPGYYPQGTISSSLATNQEVTVDPGKPIPFSINLTQAEKVCTIYLITLKANQSAVVGARRSFNGPRGTGSSTATINDSIDTSGLPAGKYRAFIYALTNCGGDAYGNEDDGYDCDGNPTCWNYCTKPSREHLDTSQVPYEPGDLYRTNANPAYYTPSLYKQAGQNSCGEQGTEQGGFPTSRSNDCDLKACDPTGKNLDVLTFNIGSGGGSAPSPSPSSNSTPVNSAAPSPSASSTAASIGATVVYPKGSTGVVSVSAANSKVSIKSGNSADLSSGLVSNANPTAYIGGSLGTKTDLSKVAVGDVNVAVAKQVKLDSTTAMTISNPDVPAVSVSIPAKTTVLSTASWDGKLQAPTQATDASAKTKPGFQLNSNTVYSFGSDSTSILLDNPATISLNNITTGVPSFKEPGGSTYTPIKSCSGNYDNPQPPAFPSECYVTDQAQKNMKIVTWHFTQFAIMDFSSPVGYVAVDGGVCLDPKDNSKYVVNVDWLSSDQYDSYYVLRTECSAFDNCNGVEKRLVSIPSNSGELENYGDPYTQVTAGKYYRYRVYGVPKGGINYSETVAVKDYDPSYFSRAIVAKVGCEAGGGLNIKEYKVTPGQVAK